MSGGSKHFSEVEKLVGPCVLFQIFLFNPEPFCPFWNHPVPSETALFSLKSAKGLVSFLRSFYPIWIYSVPSGTILSHLSTKAELWLKGVSLFNNILNHLIPQIWNQGIICLISVFGFLQIAASYNQILTIASHTGGEQLRTWNKPKVVMYYISSFFAIF